MDKSVVSYVRNQPAKSLVIMWHLHICPEVAAIPAFIGL
jgi:hypothetical protein